MREIRKVTAKYTKGVMELQYSIFEGLSLSLRARGRWNETLLPTAVLVIFNSQ